MKNILTVDHLTKTYETSNGKLTILTDISLAISQGATCAITGASGSGKTTLLGLCAGLDHASSGEIVLNNHQLHLADEDQRAQIRSQDVGFVFQNFQLIPTLTALENVMVPMELRGDKHAKAKAMNLLERVDLENRKRHYPSQLSGGEQQRIALARAFSNTPKILFADEPTGNLDEETGTKVEKLLFEINQEMGTTLVIVTHDMDLARKTQKIIQIKGGRII